MQHRLQYRVDQDVSSHGRRPENRATRLDAHRGRRRSFVTDVKSSQIKIQSSQVKSSQVKSSQVKIQNGGRLSAAFGAHRWEARAIRRADLGATGTTG